MNIKEMAQAAANESIAPVKISLTQGERFRVSHALRLQEMDLKRQLREPISNSKAESLSNELAAIVSLAKYIEIQ